MKLLVVSGLSGSGKSTALRTLEDLGHYCIDNLPVPLLPALLEQASQRGLGTEQHAAVGIDARNPEEELRQVPAILAGLEATQIECQLIFLTADTATILKRFSETRRKHPLSDRHRTLADAVAFERKVLEVILRDADLVIDTSRCTVHQLRDQIRERVVGRKPGAMSVLFQSFGYKNGVPADADFVFDARCLPNPFWEPHLRPLTGRSPEVVAYLQGQAMVTEFIAELASMLERWIPRFDADNRSYLSVAVGCTGGHHRSVYVAEQLAARLREKIGDVLVRHRELP